MLPFMLCGLLTLNECTAKLGTEKCYKDGHCTLLYAEKDFEFFRHVELCFLSHLTASINFASSLSCVSLQKQI